MKLHEDMNYYTIMHPEIYEAVKPMLDRWNGPYRWFWRPIMRIYGYLLMLSDWITGYDK